MRACVEGEQKKKRSDDGLWTWTHVLIVERLKKGKKKGKERKSNAMQ